MKPSSLIKSRLFWTSAAFVVMIVLPLYAALVVVAAKTKLFDPHAEAFTDEQYKAIWAFLGVALGTAATVMGAILTKSSSDKNLAQQRESERRQKLDTAVQALGLIKHDDKYAPKAVASGALATLVHLGHPSIAMRTTEVAILDGAVAVPTAVWLIDEILMENVGETTEEALLNSKQEAVVLLGSMASEQLVVGGAPLHLAEDSSHSFNFPSSAVAAWPKGLLADTHYQLLNAMISLLVSRSPTWWGVAGTWTWVLYSIDEMVQVPSVDLGARQSAATYGMRLLDVIGHGWVEGLRDNRDPADVKERLRPFAVAPEDQLWQWESVSRWCEAADASGGSS